MIRTRRCLLRRLIPAFLIFATYATAAAVPAVWSNVSGGTVAGTSFTITGVTTPILYSGRDLNAVAFVAEPFSSVQTLQVGAGNDWTVSFGNPLVDLLLYVSFWRGEYTTDPDGTTTYTFDQSFSVLSGLTGAGVTSNTVSLPDGAYYDGILRFSGPVSSLSVLSTGGAAGADNFGQELTFAASAVPEPSGTGLFAPGLALAAWLRLRRSIIHG